MTTVFDPRSSWAPSPDPTYGTGPSWPAPPRGLVVHYVGGAGMLNLTDHASCCRLLRGMLAYALRGGNGWHYSDIEYNLAACPHAHLIELRGLAWEGGAQLNDNVAHASIVALLNQGDVLTANIAHALAQGRAAVRDIGGGSELYGHREVVGNPTGTECPGDQIVGWIHAGGLDPFAPTSEDDVERGLAVDLVTNPADPSSGYTLDRWGGVHPFGKAVPPGPGGAYWPNADVARRLVITNWAQGAGYVMDLMGGVHAFGGAKAPTGVAYFAGAPLVPIGAKG